MCCRSRHQTVALWERLACATAKAMAEMYEAYPIWWRGVSAPPPAEWTYTFETFTGEETAGEWALAAAVFIAQKRRRTGAGPTFAELFAHLLPDTGGLPAPFPDGLEPIERHRAIAGFRGHVTIEWRRRGMIGFTKGVMRSLRVGREFREHSRQRQQKLVSRVQLSPAGVSEMSQVPGIDVGVGSVGGRDRHD